METPIAFVPISRLKYASTDFARDTSPADHDDNGFRRPPSFKSHLMPGPPMQVEISRETQVVVDPENVVGTPRGRGWKAPELA